MMNGTEGAALTLLSVLIGLVLFLFGMQRLESGIREYGYEAFTRLLSRSTNSALGSAGTGVLVTALLQSSSMVSLLVLAFASAAVLPLYNAVGIILGANLGTTATGWLVTTIGFKLSLQQAALPLMAAGGLLQLVNRAPAVGRLVFGLGLIIFGLEQMKVAVSGLPDQWDLSALRTYGVWLYFPAGIAIATLIQSSSATMMITLAALNGGLIDLPSAIAITIGADLGTTSTTALASIGGSTVKRQLALAHFSFNVAATLTAMTVLLPLLPVLLSWSGLTDPLYSVVAFHSLFNGLGLAFFLTILGPYSRWIGRRFLGSRSHERPLLDQPTDVPEAALVLVGQVLDRMRLDACALVMHDFQLQPEQLLLPLDRQLMLRHCVDERLTVEERYSRIKQQETDLVTFAQKLQQQELEESQVSLLMRQQREARSLAYSSKTLKDIRTDLITMRHNAVPAIARLYRKHRRYIRRMQAAYLRLSAVGEQVDEESISSALADNDEYYNNANAAVQELAAGSLLSGAVLSTLFNVNRDVHHALKDLLRALT